MERSIILPMSVGDWKRVLKGQKTWQITKAFPSKLIVPSETNKVTVYVYTNKQIVGTYRCSKVFCDRWYDTTNDWITNSIELVDMGAVINKPSLRSLRNKDIYLWRIDNIEVYNTPRTMSEFGFDGMNGKWLYV